MSKVRGRVSVHPKGFGFLELLEPGPVSSAFISPPLLNPFLAGDVVSAELSESAPGRFNATNLNLVERARETVFGEVVFRGPQPYLRIDRQVANTDWPMEADAGAFAAGAFVLGKLSAERVLPLAQVEEAEASLMRLTSRYQLARDHSEAAEAQAAQSSETTLGHRRDLRELLTVTIDGPSSKDLDDALSILPATPDGAMRVFVSIADVDAFVPEGSAVDREARARATSVYLAGATLPMIPRSLSENALSLLEGQERGALTVELRIDGEGQICSVDIYPSLIRSDARLTYAQVAEFLDRGRAELPAPIQGVLRWLRTAAARLKTVRASRGGVRISSEEATIMWDEQEPTSIQARTSTSAHALVERLMVAANEAVAAWLVERGLPGVFRVLSAPETERVQALADFARNFGFEPGFTKVLTPRGLQAFENQFRGTDVEPAISKVLTQVLGPARYTVMPEQHFGLGASLYVHFTSPIRRYADLIVHRIIKRYLHGDRDQVAEDPQIESMCSHINDMGLRARKAERERFRMIAARLFKSEIGSTYAGNIVAVRPFGLVVQLSGVAVAGTVASDALGDGHYRYDDRAQAMVGPKQRFEIGSPIVVEVVGVNESLGRIELSLAR